MVINRNPYRKHRTLWLNTVIPSLMMLFSIVASGQAVSFSGMDGFSGQVTISVNKGYYFEPYFAAKQQEVVITGFEEGKYDDALRAAGITFPYTLEKSSRFDFVAEARIAETDAPNGGGAGFFESVAVDFNTSRGMGSGQEFPPFSNQAKEWLKNKGSDESIVGKALSGGEMAWDQHGRIDNIKVIRVYLTDFKNEIQQAIRNYTPDEADTDSEDNEEKEASDDPEKPDFWSGKETEQKATSDDDATGSSSEDVDHPATGAKKADPFWSGQGTKEEETQLEKKIANETENEYLGEKSVVTKQIKIAYYDHGSIDGDRVSVLLNGQVVASNVTLTESPQSVVVQLKEGINRVSFQALNNGTLPPNTATFYIYDGEGAEIYQNAWNITEGHRSTLLVIKN